MTTRSTLGRMGSPDELAKVASFLGSDESSYVTVMSQVYLSKEARHRSKSLLTGDGFILCGNDNFYFRNKMFCLRAFHAYNNNKQFW